MTSKIRFRGATSGFVELAAPDAAGSNTLTLPTSNGTAGQYLQTSGTSGELSWQTVTDTSTSVAVLVDQKTQNTPGGSFAAAAWRTRDLNTEVSDPDGIVSLSSNQFTLGAGTYLIHWDAPAYRVARHMSRLYDVTNTAVVELGLSSFTEITSNIQTSSTGSAGVTITGNTTYRIEHQSGSTQNTNGFGVESNLTGGGERYTRVTIWKVA